MLPVLKKIFESNLIETENNEQIKIHSHTSLAQGLFLQKIFDIIKPKKSLEVGLAYGISTLFILEKCREYSNEQKCHIAIEPFPWGQTALFNIKKENLDSYLDIQNKLSDMVLPSLYMQNHRIQFAYIDTTKVFDIVLQDFYFIDKILDVNGVVIFDDCGGGWPGIQRVVRFVSTLPHYQVLDKHREVKSGPKKEIALSIATFLLKLIPLKSKLFPSLSFTSDREMELNYSCIAFKKIANDSRNWDWSSKF
jgi:predicted O-methyltransferase YrrM